MSKIENYREYVLRQADKDIIMVEDGEYKFWPYSLNGYFSSYDLKIIAEELDRRNRNV